MPRNDGDLPADLRAGGASEPGRAVRPGSGAPVTRRIRTLSPPTVWTECGGSLAEQFILGSGDIAQWTRVAGERCKNRCGFERTPAAVTLLRRFAAEKFEAIAYAARRAADAAAVRAATAIDAGKDGFAICARNAGGLI